MKTLLLIASFIVSFQLNNFAQSKESIPTEQRQITIDSTLKVDNWLKNFNLSIDISSIKSNLSLTSKENRVKKIESKVVYSLDIIKPDIDKYPHLRWEADLTKKYHILQTAPSTKAQK